MQTNEMQFDLQRLPLDKLVNNDGQITGVPKNPRILTEKEYKRLKRKLRDLDFTNARPLIAFPMGEQYVVFCGNQRLRALREIGKTEVACAIVPPDTTPEDIVKILLADNKSEGEWDNDILANEYDQQLVQEWAGVAEMKDTERLSVMEYKPLYYEPEQVPELSLADCINEERYKAKLQVIEQAELSDDIKRELKKLAYRFIRIDFGKVANYYAFNASDEEKRVLERLRVILVDNGSIGGFIEDDLLRVKQTTENWANEE